MLRILLADDHAVVRQGVKQILADAFARATFGEAQNAQQLLELVSSERWDIVVLDLNMPGGNGLEALKQIKHNYPQLPVLILSMYPEDQYAVRAIRAGASGYLTKNKAARELIAAVQRVASGKKYIAPGVGEQLAVELEMDSKEPPHKKLSDREYQVMCMIASGKPVKQIADELSLSVSTISTNRTRILRKMKLKNNAEITRYALKEGLTE